MKCAKCGSTEMLQRHHLYSKTKLAKKLYGDLIHDPKNIMILCADHHLNHPVKKMSEVEFCKKLDIEPRSKMGKIIWERIKREENQ